MEAAESLRFEEEIRSLITPPAVSGSSFTALLGLQSNQAVELLHEPLALPAGCSPTFPTNRELIERAARFSVFAAAGLPEVSNSVGNSPGKMKLEPAVSGERTVGNKRKEVEKSKVKMSSKKSKSVEENNGGEKLPYVHVRARRGEATDSHSLAERARREKINARMKLLQELVPGCSKISGTALVLDEIINHVQSLQRQVEFLSMRLAAVNPRIDFSGLDNILSSECGRLTSSNRIGTGTVAMEQSTWLDGMINGCKQQQQQVWLLDPQQQQIWERDVIVSNPVTTSIYGYNSSNPSSGKTVKILVNFCYHAANYIDYGSASEGTCPFYPFLWSPKVWHGPLMESE